MGIRIGSGVMKAALAIAVLLANGATLANGGPGAVRKQIESSLLVTGKIDVDSAGKVTRYLLDDKDKLPVGVVRLLDKTVPFWTFEPATVDGKAVNATTAMNIRVVAHKVDADSYEVRIRNAAFGAASGEPGETIEAVSMEPPKYPMVAANAGVTGTAYLLLRVGRDGKVSDAIAEQVNLKIVTSENVMKQWRRIFEVTSTTQARKWTFALPTRGKYANSDFWVVRVPVVFNLGDPEKAKTPYGSWESYVPGPRQRNPWSDGDKEGAGFSPDMLAPGGTYLAGSGLKLLSDPTQS